MKGFHRDCSLLGLLALLILFAVPPVRAEQHLSSVEESYLRSRGPVVFVSQSQYAPFEFIQDDGNRDGMCIELARWIATEFGFKAQFIDTSFAHAQAMIQNGEADVLTSFFYSAKRDQSFDFTQTMFTIPATIFVAAERPDIKSLEDLNGKTLAIQKGDYAEEFLREREIDFQIVQTANFADAADQVIAGQADALIGDEQIVLYYLYSNDLEDSLKKVGEPLYTGENAMAVVEGQQILLDILNKGIALAAERGVLETINNKWLGTRLSSSANLFYTYRWWIGLALAVLLTLLISIWFWNLSLRRLVRRRTRTLLENERFLDTIIEHIPNMLFMKDARDLRFIKFNRAGEKLIGYRREALLGKNDYDLFPVEQADRFVQRDREVLQSGCPVDIPEEELLTRHQGVRTLHTQKIPILDDKGRPKYLLGISEDITDRLASEAQRRKSDELLRAAIAAMDEGFVIYDQNDHLVMCNQKYRELYPSIAELMVPGVSYQELLEAYSRELFTDPQERRAWLAQSRERHREPCNAEVETLEGRWVKLAERQTSDGSTVGIRVDISANKEAEKRLREALTEKETLLKEVHHRVKNNMQVISSLLSLQMETITDHRVKDAFNEASGRIRAMALVHENLYRAESFNKISVDEYFRNLTTQLVQLLDYHQRNVAFEIEVAEVAIAIDDAIPFGLIVTEILTNAIKYAFPEQDRGKVRIMLTEDATGRKRLQISDNGIGFADDFEAQQSSTLGIRLIRDLVEGHLEGTSEVDGRNGVTWTVIWPASPVGRRVSG